MAGLFGRTGAKPKSGSLEGLGRGAGSGADKLFLLGALMNDLGAGGGPQMLMGAQQHLAGRDQQQRQQSAMNGLLATLDPGKENLAPAVSHSGYGGMGPGEDGEPVSAPQAAPAARRQPSLQGSLPALMRLRAAGGDIGPFVDLLKAAQPEKPSYIEGPDGIYEITRGGTPKRVADFPAREEKVSPGWSANPDGSWAPVKNGPYDPDYIARTSGVRREAVVSRPTPSRARAGGRSSAGSGSGGLPPPPPGFVRPTR